jgi:hypothetical protein
MYCPVKHCPNNIELAVPQLGSKLEEQVLLDQSKSDWKPIYKL